MNYGEPKNVCCTLEQERDTPEVARAMNAFYQVVERYDHLVTRLHDRLRTVATPPPPVEQEVKESGYTTELANDINRLRCRFRDITDNLEGLYERIEL